MMIQLIQVHEYKRYETIIHTLPQYCKMCSFFPSVSLSQTNLFDFIRSVIRAEHSIFLVNARIEETLTEADVVEVGRLHRAPHVIRLQIS